MRALSAIEVPRDAAERIQSWGNEAVTALCEAALGSLPGLRQKVRTNAAALVARMNHPQAIETVPLLIGDANPAVAIRAIRGVARRRDVQLVGRLGQVLGDGEVSPLVAAETVVALLAIDSPEARTLVNTYRAASPGTTKHRGSPIVERVLRAHRNR